MVTDFEERYDLFVNEVESSLTRYYKKEDISYYFMVAVYFEGYTSGIDSNISAHICSKKPGSSENKCRSRNYYVYGDMKDEEMADLIVRDIVSNVGEIELRRYGG